MTQRAFVLGGTGQIGRAVARRFLERGWDVDVGARNEAHVVDGARFVRVDRDDGLDVVPEVDALVDVVAYERAHAEQLLALRGRVRTLVVVSSASVYADTRGRTLDEATDLDSFPVLPVPVPERNATVAPGDETYSTKKVAIEQTLLERATVPVTIVRPCAIYGVGAPLPRELFFVKRILDGRRAVVLAHRGESRFHTTSTRNLAELVVLAAERPGTRVVNCGDPDPPTVLEIGRTIAAHFGHEWTELLLPGAPVGSVGTSPWAVPRPFLVDMTTAELELRYLPVATYARAVGEVCDWIAETIRARDWRKAFARVEEHMGNDFDYAAEDEYVKSLT